MLNSILSSVGDLLSIFIIMVIIIVIVVDMAKEYFKILDKNK